MMSMEKVRLQDALEGKLSHSEGICKVCGKVAEGYKFNTTLRYGKLRTTCKHCGQKEVVKLTEDSMRLYRKKKILLEHDPIIAINTTVQHHINHPMVRNIVNYGFRI